MRKTVIGMAMMALALIGFNGMAQNTTQSQKAQVENNACGKKGDKDNKKGGKMQAREKKNPYEGLTLTEAQKTKLADLDSKRMADRKAKMEARKAQKEGRKADKKSMTDTEKKAAKQTQKAQARKAERLEYLQKVKAIVGPEQYVVFLENMYVNGGHQGGGKAIKQGQKGGKQGLAHNKGGKNHRKGDRKGGQKGGQRSQKNNKSTNAQS